MINLKQLQKTIAPAKLLAVTKGRSAADVRELIDSGIKNIGENKLQEIESKYDANLLEELQKKKIHLHFIGPVQRNKVNKLTALCDTFHAIDSYKLAEKIDAAARVCKATVRIFLQLNLTEEPQKNGILVRNKQEQQLLENLIKKIHALHNIQLLGFMVMGKQGDPSTTRKVFKKAKQLADRWSLSELSMGMSQDYPIALEEGSTFIRIGSALFSD